MIYTLTITDEAKEDLREIYRYISVDLCAPINASRQLDRIEKNILSLNEMPDRFPRYSDDLWKKRGLRYCVVDNYVIFFLIDKDKKTVSVMRILYSRRNIDSILKNM